MKATTPTNAPISGSLSFSRILVTGAEGFVGSYLVPALAKRLIAGAVITTASRSENRSNGPHRSVSFDLESPDSIGAVIADVQPDLIVHLAAQSSVGRSQKSAAQTWEVNLGGSISIARAVAEIVPSCTVLFASSVEVYGLSFNEGIANEESPLRPQSAYSRSKASAELMFMDVLPETSRLIIARPCNHSGPGQRDDFVVPSFAGQIARAERGEERIIRVGNLDAERDFLDVEDVTSAYLSLLEASQVLPMRTTFNIASGETLSIREVLTRLLAFSSVEIEVKEDLSRLRRSEVTCAALDISKLSDCTGWKPIHSIDDMLLRVLEYQRATFDTSCNNL